MLRYLVAMAVVVLVFGTTIFSQALAARTPEENDLCPIASNRLNRSVNYQNNTIKAPVTVEEKALLMETLRGPEGAPRTIAILRLALAGDLDAFRILHQRKDANGLFSYSGRYINRDGTVCLDPALEQAFRDELQDPVLGRSLATLLRNNTFRDKRTLVALRRFPFQAASGPADKYLIFGRAITATHLPEIEAEVLAHARTFLPFDTPVKKRVLPGLHQHYVKFFAGRGYAPAVPYFQELLSQANRSEPIQSFQINYGMLRTVVQRALAKIGTAESGALLVEELQYIANKPLDAFSAAELQTLSKLLISIQPSETLAIVTAYKKMLLTPQQAKYDYPMRRTIYPTLVNINIPESSNLLLSQLNRYVGNELLPNRNATVAILFEALVNVENLNLDPILILAENMTNPVHRRIVWHVIKRHSSEEGIDFLLSELRSITGDPNHAQQRLGPEANKHLLNSLLSFESTKHQSYVREGIDTLFTEGMLVESEYMTASSSLNKALGDKSPTYVAFRSERVERRAAEKKQKQQLAEKQGRQEMQAEYAAAFTQHSSAEGIADNIESLASSKGDVRRATQWLIIVGTEALPQLHEALKNSNLMGRQGFRILNVLGEIGNPDSITPIIVATENRQDGGLHRPALFALALMPSTEEAIAFAYEQLESGVPERQQSAGLVYLAQIRHKESKGIIGQYIDGKLSMRLRSAGLYLAARLGTPGVIEMLESLLLQSKDRSELEFLLTSLSEIAPSIEEFTRIATSAGFTESLFRYQQLSAYCAFRTVTGELKKELAYKTLEDNGIWQRREAIRYLIENDPQGIVDRLTGGIGQFLPIHKLLSLSSEVQLLFSESRRMGYLLMLSDRGYQLVPIPK